MLEWLARRYEQLKRFAPMISMGLQSLTLATLVFSLVAWRGFGYWMIPLLVGVIVAAACALAWVWYVPLDMRRHERLAQMELNPIESDILLSPKEAWAWHMMANLVAGKMTVEEYQQQLDRHVMRRRRSTQKAQEEV